MLYLTTQVGSAPASSEPYYYLLNLQGDVLHLANTSGELVASYTYDPYGTILTVSGSLSDVNPLGYRGYYYDTESGFYYLQSRYYDPIVKRFLNADSYASTGQGFLGYNMFAYCENAPVIAADNNGHECVSIAINGGGGITPPPPDYRTYEDETLSQLNNCYSYAFDLQYNHNPGDIASSKGILRTFYKALARNTYNEKSPNISVIKMSVLVIGDMNALGKNCRIIKTPEYRQQGETVIAMKTTEFILENNHIDYHFAVLLSDGSWADKTGSDPVRRGEISGYDNSWPYNKDYHYCSTTIYFAVGG